MNRPGDDIKPFRVHEKGPRTHKKASGWITSGAVVKRNLRREEKTMMTDDKDKYLWRMVMYTAGKWFFCIFFVFLANLLFAQTGSRVFEHNGNFSYRPPLNWTVSEVPGLVHRVAFGSTEEGFAANINFIDERFTGTLNAYVNENISQMQTFFSEFRIISRTEFRTHSGIVGERVETNNVQHNMHLRQIFYFFPLSRNRFVVVTASVLDSVSARLIPLFDESIKTFELIN